MKWLTAIDVLCPREMSSTVNQLAQVFESNEYNSITHNEIVTCVYILLLMIVLKTRNIGVNYS
jgi:hypothetical protein